jgi:beta-xylosidase
MKFHYQGVKQQPTSFEDRYNLVKGTVQHAVDRYGKEEVKKWDFEVYNEGWLALTMLITADHNHKPTRWAGSRHCPATREEETMANTMRLT